MVFFASSHLSFSSDQPDDYDFAHTIQEITIGSKIKKISEKNIGSFNSLGGREKTDGNGLESHEYVMKIVPTTYEDLSGNVVRRFSMTIDDLSFNRVGLFRSSLLKLHS